MKFEALSLTCDCGRPSSAFVQVGLTDDHQLAFSWSCEGCNEVVYAFKSLAECWRECPSREQVNMAEDPAAIIPDTELEDATFLSAMGICVPAEME